MAECASGREVKVELIDVAGDDESKPPCPDESQEEDEGELC
jgi:hypothetical protein